MIYPRNYSLFELLSALLHYSPLIPVPARVNGRPYSGKLENALTVSNIYMDAALEFCRPKSSTDELNVNASDASVAPTYTRPRFRIQMKVAIVTQTITIQTAG